MFFPALMRVAASVLVLLLCLTPLSYADQSDKATEYYYAIEQSGTVCGYAHSRIIPSEFEGQPATRLIDSMWLKIKAMGKSIEGEYVFDFLLDPVTGQYFYHTSKIDQASMHLGGITTVRGDTAIMVDDITFDTSVVALPEGTLFQNTRLFPQLLALFSDNTPGSNELPVFSEIDAAVQSVVFTYKGDEDLELVGQTYRAMEVHMLNKVNGMSATSWIDRESSLLLRMEHPIRTVYLTDAGVVDRIQEAGHDEHIFSKVDTIIANPWAISYMKVRAKLNPGGMWLTNEALNVGGQSFTGSVEDNFVDGVFEMSWDRYDGTNAPAFPCDFSGIDSLKSWLEPADLIESDDPVLVARAKTITEGSADAWEAMTRLSQWVNEEISYDLPGGVTARKTYDTRLGECGSHANLLAAFCRAVGIPARCVFGCMYVPSQGGSFGQHAWNEIYMGETAGWIPIDCTADEVTYADCGHLRLGEWTSMAVMLNPDEMEVLEVRTGEGTFADLMGSESSYDYDLYVGEFQGPDKVLTVLVQNDRLALDVPGQMVFELKEADSDGEWFFVLTDKASVSFDLAPAGMATALTITSRQRLPYAVNDSTAVDPDVTAPGDIQPLLGKYNIPMQSVAFDVTWQNDALTVLTPGGGAMTLQPTDSEGWWQFDTGKSTLMIGFDRDDDGTPLAMRLNELVPCPKKVEASDAQSSAPGQ